MATIEEFAQITRNVIATEEFSEHLPTALYPERKVLVVLEGAPVGAGLEPVALAWATEEAIDDEEFLVAFKIDATTFKVIRRCAGQLQQGVFSAVDDA